MEFDLQATADGVPILFHDDTLNRTTDGSGAVSERSLAEIRTLDAGGWVGTEYAGEPVPTLEEALVLLGPGEASIFAELKGPAPASTVDAVTDLLLGAGLEDRAVVISMDWDALGRIRDRAPDLRVGYIAEGAHRMDDAFRLAGARSGDLVDPDFRLLAERPDLAARGRSEGIPMAVWTVNEMADAAAMADLGVRHLTTNQVERLLTWREG